MLGVATTARRGILNMAQTGKQPHEVEQKHVKEVYESIASHFSSTRYSPWPQVVNFIRSLGPSELLLDVGCGNGKYMKEHVNTYGCDNSTNLASICKRKEGEVLLADNLNLPYRSDTYDAVISIAVIHHFASVERRIRSIQQLVRVCRPSGRILIYVWAFEQTGRNQGKYQEQDAYIPWTLSSRFRGKHTTEDDTVLLRYYHLFRQGELERLIDECTTGVLVEQSGFDHQNWFVILRKD